MTYQTLTANFMGAYLPAEQSAPTVDRLMRQYRLLATGRGASDIDQWIDQLNARQVRQLHWYEENAEPEASVLKVVCHQFLTLTVGGRVTREQLEDIYAAARQRVAERLEDKQ